MPDSIAIVGFSDRTLPYLKDSAAQEIWTMNHHLFLDEHEPTEKRNLPRVDRLFELHRPDWFTRKEVTLSGEYLEWLKQPHDFPIYMIEAWPDMPSAIPFPREAVKHDLFKHLWRGTENEQEYYTSSAGLMLALAIHMGVPRIELYGIEMETDTEYADQKPAFEYMVGFANGRDIDVILHPKCSLCNATVYGYEGVPHVVRSRLGQLKITYNRLLKKWTQRQERLTQAFNADPENKDPKVHMEAEAWRAMYLGATIAIKTLEEMHDEYISAQNLEEKMSVTREQEDFFKGRTNMSRAAFDEIYNDGAGDIEQAKKAWLEYLDNRATMFAHDGAYQVYKVLRAETRLMKPDPTLQMQILEG